MKKTVLFLVLIFSVVISRSQTFVFYDRYDQTTKKILKDRGFESMHILTIGNIDPKRTERVDFNVVDNFLRRTFEKNKTYYLVIDWEEQLYRNIRRYNKNDFRFKQGEKEYINLIKFIKQYNPNIKVGIYGFPTRLPIRKKAPLSQKKFDNLFKHLDFISPSVYTLSPVTEVGEKVNVEYFTENLKQALLYGKRLNKPVFPFLWEIIHPDNAIYGKTLLSDEEFISNIKLVKEYSYSGTSVDGFIWWAPKKASQVYLNHKSSTGISFNFLTEANEHTRNKFMQDISSAIRNLKD